MKKSLLALAVFGAFAGAASAQSSVTVYGIVDLNVARTDTADGKLTSMGTGNQSQSRIGFKGVEDLGNGLKATFNLEQGFDSSNGAEGNDGLAFSREAWVGLEGSFGTFRAGRMDLPIYLAMDSVDPFSTGTLGDIGTLFPSLDNKPRASNMLYYKTPSFGGFFVEGDYTFGETAGDTKDASSYGVVLGYENGPLVGKLAYNVVNGSDTGFGFDPAATPPVASSLISDAKDKDIFVGASYDFGVVKLHGAYLRNKVDDNPGTTTKTKSGMIGVSVPLGAGTFLADYTMLKDDLLDDNDSKKLSIGYVYALSKRTNLYTTVARVNNDDRATRAAYGTTENAGDNSTAYQVGIRHTF